MFPESQVLYEALTYLLIYNVKCSTEDWTANRDQILMQVSHCPKPKPSREHRASLEGLVPSMRGRHLPQWLRQYGVSCYSGKYTVSLITEGTLILLRRVRQNFKESMAFRQNHKE